MTMWMVHNRLLKTRVWPIGFSLRLVLTMSLISGLMTSLNPTLAYAQEAPVGAVQASGDVAAADEAASPEASLSAGREDISQRVSILTGQSAMAVLQQWPQAAVWLNADAADGASRAVLALLFTPSTTTATTAVVVLADEASNAGEATVTTLARGLANRGLAALTLGLPAPPGLLGQWMERELPLPRATPANGSGLDAADDSMLIDVMPGADVSDAEAQYRLGVTADVQAAVRYLKREGYQKIVIAGLGRGASFITAVPELAESDGLIWLMPRFYPRDRQELKQHIGAASHLRVLDIQPARGDNLRIARERTATMSQVEVALYQRQRVAVNEPVQARHGDALASRMAAWIGLGSDTAAE